MSEQAKIAASAQRLDACVAGLFQLSRKRARQAIVAGAVRLNGRTVRILAREVKAGDKLALEAVPAELPARVSDSIELIYEDRDLVVINKPAGLLSERMPGEKGRAVLDALQDRGIRGELVHRLDAGTSGVMLVARTADAAAVLSDMFRQKGIQKLYALFCAGSPGDGSYELALGRDPAHPRRFAVRPGGKASRTEYRTLAAGEVSFAVAAPVTGRTHQIRVHFSSAGHALVGDALYQGPRHIGSLLVKRPLLHAWRLELEHPRTARAIRFVSPLPEDFIAAASAAFVPPQFLTDPPPFGSFR